MRNVITLLSLYLIIGLTHAQNILPNAKMIGSGSLNYLIWEVYDAQLFADDVVSFNQPFALTLIYKRELYGEQIAERSAQEIQKLGFNDTLKLADWEAQMRSLFPNVNDGTRLTGVYRPNQGTDFYLDDLHIGRIEDVAFGQWFFGIWLDKNTSEPELRRALLGQK